MESPFGELAINGVSFALLCFGWVEAVKKLGVKGKWLTVFALLFGAGVAIGYQLSLMYPAFGVWFNIAVYGLGGGLAAAGYYDFLKAKFPKPTEPQEPLPFEE